MSRLSLSTLLLFSGLSSSEIVESYPTERPTRTVSQPGQLFVALGETSSVRFKLANGRVVSVELNVAGRRSVSNIRDCEVPSSIHVDSMQLLREDLRKDKYRRDAYTLLFDVGSEQEKSFDQSPRITLYWVSGRLVDADILRAIDQTIGRTERLCRLGAR